MTIGMGQNKLCVDRLSLGDGMKVVYNPRRRAKKFFI
jgi:hypothetical protein